jgi:uncharacterized membrane protein
MVSKLKRIARHVFATTWSARRAFTDEVLGRIEAAVHAGEGLHDGEVRFAIETELGWPALLAGESARERALEVFAFLRTWDTERNNGVLIYVLFADRDVEIVADRGFNDRVTHEEWQRICDLIRGHFARGEFEAGSLDGIAAVSELMAAHFPAVPGRRRDELPDRPVFL